jgi:Fe-Mn family superoxide dismutase
MSFELPALPYEKNALEPTISAETLEFHHGKHHNAYVVKLNELIAGTEFENMSLEEIVQKSSGGMFNQAAHIWNHTFYFTGLGPNAGGEPTGALADAINSAFGSFDEFKKQFIAKGMGNFGSGWTWLVKNGDALEIVNTDDAETPLTNGQTPVLTIDVWEHAYYIDYRNARPMYLEEIWNVVDWNVAAERFAG